MSTPTVHDHTLCRACKQRGLMEFLYLGKQPPANALLSSASDKEEKYDLGLGSCPTCGLIQLTRIVNPNVLFKNYVYYSSISQRMTEHFARYAHDIADRFVPENGLILEIGSNDGVLLQALKGRKVRALGVDPADAVARNAQSKGIETIIDFFNEDTALKIREKYGPASAVIANNVFAHIDDLDSVLKGVNSLLSPDGIFVIETPHVVDFLERLEFDTIYHEHLSYFGVEPLGVLFGRFGFEIFDVRKQKVHGGSIRVFARHKKCVKYPVSPSVSEFLEAEKAARTKDGARLQEFSRAVEGLRSDLIDTVSRLKKEGKKIIGYGAPAKGNVLLNYCGFTANEIEYLVDDTPAKQGLYSPGVKIPIRSPAHFHSDNVDVALLLAWNHQEEILAKEQAFIKKGGRFLIPVPRVRMI